MCNFINYFFYVLRTIVMVWCLFDNCSCDPPELIIKLSFIFCKRYMPLRIDTKINVRFSNKKILKDCLTNQLTNPHSKTSKNGHFQYFPRLFHFLNIKYL